jgi:hypothetical protein
MQTHHVDNPLGHYAQAWSCERTTACVVRHAGVLLDGCCIATDSPSAKGITSAVTGYHTTTAFKAQRLVGQGLAKVWEA